MEPLSRKPVDVAMERPPPSDSSATADVAVILVHGTFASELAFPRQSLLRSKCDEHFGKEVAVPFGWSGGNSPRARETGADQLVSHIEELSKTKKAIFVVAHSHGAIVSLKALGRELSKTAQSKLQGAVALGTPFLHFRKRSGAVISLIAGMTWFLFAAVGGTTVNWLYREASMGQLQLALLSTILLGGAALLLLLKWQEKKCAAFCERSFLFKGPLPCPLLCLFDERDEAYWWLRFQSFVVAVLVVLPPLAFVPTWISASMTPPVEDTIYLPMFVTDWDAAAGPQNQSKTDHLTEIEKVRIATEVFIKSVEDLKKRKAEHQTKVFMIAMAPCVCAALLIVVSTAIQGWFTGVGVAPLGTYMWFNVLPSRVPIGLGVIEVLPVEMESRNRSLWHSRYYSDSNAVDGVIAWLRPRIEACRNSGPATSYGSR